MIFARRGIAIQEFPSLLSHLEAFREGLEPRPYDWDGPEWKGRKPGSYAWYEIQDSVDYFAQFSQPKIVYQEIQYHSRYSIDFSGAFTNNKALFLANPSTWLLAVLNGCGSATDHAATRGECVNFWARTPIIGRHRASDIASARS